MLSGGFFICAERAKRLLGALLRPCLGRTMRDNEILETTYEYEAAPHAERILAEVFQFLLSDDEPKPPQTTTPPPALALQFPPIPRQLISTGGPST